MEIKKDIRFRVYLAFTCLCLLGGAVLVKAAIIQVEEGPELRALGRDINTRVNTLTAERGNIYSEDGKLLCSTIPRFDIHIDFSVIDKKLLDDSLAALARGIATVFGDRSPDYYLGKLRRGKERNRQYFLLKKSVAYHEFQALRELPIFRRGRYRGGFIHEPRPKRVNPFGKLAYRTIGLWRENSPAIGIEAAYDSILQGIPGQRIEQKMTGGVWVPLNGTETEPENGKDLVTTLDMRIQDIAETAMESVLRQYDAQYGTCIVMEVETGKIRALVNLGRQKDGSYWEDFNYALVPTEPGSTFKLMTLYSLLKDRYISVEDRMDAEGGAIAFGRRVMRDAHLGIRETTIKQAFAQSSNAAMAKLVHQYYYKDPGQFIENLRFLRLDRPTGIDIPGERRSVLKSPKDPSWSATTLPWMATGYEVMISPLQLCMVYNAVANDGKMMKPYLISAIREYGQDEVRFAPEVLIPAIGDSSLVAQLQECVREVAVTGTAKHIQGPYYPIAGKTGTAQVADKGIRYSDRVYQGSFVGYFPADHPRYTIAVTVRTRPYSRAYYGGTVAAPVFQKIADKIFSSESGSWSSPLDSLRDNQEPALVVRAAYAPSLSLLLPRFGAQAIPQQGWVERTEDSMSTTPWRLRTMSPGSMPDVRGMGFRDALYLLEQRGLRVEKKGNGQVHAQSIEPGSPVQKGESVRLELKI